MKENASATRSKRWIQSALLELMKEKPYNDIHISEICQRADLTRPTFYRYFKTKEEVLSQYLDVLVDEFMLYVQNRGADSLGQAALHFFTFWEQHLDFIELLERNGVFDLINKRLPQYFDSVSEFFTFAPQQISEHERAYHHVFLSGGVISMLRKWLINRGNEDVQTLANYVENIFVGALSATAKEVKRS